MICIERYQQISSLGKGGMGAVWLVQDKETLLFWAMKEISTSNTTFETTYMSTLCHPNIPHVMTQFKKEGKTYLLMEYIEGTSLSQYIEQHGKSEEKLVLDWMLQLVDILVYLHKIRILYCDLKPENLILSNSGKIYLIDFGIAERMDMQSMIHFGTIGYASPEQYEYGVLDERVDIYGVGKVMMALLSGVYKGDHFQNMLPSHIYMTECIKKLVNRCLHVEKEKRYQTMQGLRHKMIMCRLYLQMKTLFLHIMLLHRDFGHRYE